MISPVLVATVLAITSPILMYVGLFHDQEWAFWVLAFTFVPCAMIAGLASKVREKEEAR